MIEAHVRAVADGARGEEAGEAAADRVEQRRRAADVQVAVLLPGEARARQIFRGRRGAHGDVGSGNASEARRQRLVRRDRLVGDHARQLGGGDQAADLGAARHQRLHVVRVDAVEQLVDARVEARRSDEVPVGFRGHGEPVRHADAQRRKLADQFAERGDLAAHQPHVGEPHFRKPANETHAHASGGNLRIPPLWRSNGELVNTRVTPASRKPPAPRSARARGRAAPSAGRRRTACSCGSARRGGCCAACRGSRRRTRRER